MCIFVKIFIAYQKNTWLDFAVTIIVPVYNEEEALPRFKEEMDSWLKNSSMQAKVLFVDDGSSDSSFDIITQICDAPDYDYIRLAKNSGLSTALKAGFDQVTTPYTGYIDADLQTHPDEFDRFAPFLEECAMVNGWRKNRNDSFVKIMSSKVANAVRRGLINDHMQDTCCPLKIIKTPYVKRMPFFKGMHRFIPALIQLQGGVVKEIEVTHYPRMEGKAKYNLLNRAIGPLVDTFAFRWMRKRYIRYQIQEKKVSSSEAVSSVK